MIEWTLDWLIKLSIALIVYIAFLKNKSRKNLVWLSAFKKIQGCYGGYIFKSLFILNLKFQFISFEWNIWAFLQETFITFIVRFDYFVARFDSSSTSLSENLIKGLPWISTSSSQIAHFKGTYHPLHRSSHVSPSYSS